MRRANPKRSEQVVRRSALYGVPPGDSLRTWFEEWIRGLPRATEPPARRRAEELPSEEPVPARLAAPPAAPWKQSPVKPADASRWQDDGGEGGSSGAG
jgi:hypothetical protein